MSPSPRRPRPRRRRASAELSAAPTSPPGPAVPARPSPRAPRTLSNPLGARRLLREGTLAEAGAAATRLGARRRRGARYAEPGGGARAGAQRRRVLAGLGRGAAAAVAAAAGAQGPLHHWQPWSPSIFLPRGTRPRGAGGRRRASPEGGRRDVRWRGGCEPRWSFLRARLVLTAAPRPGREGRRRRLLTRRRWRPDGLVQRLQPMPFKGTRGGAGRCRQTGRASAAGGRRAGGGGGGGY